MAARTNTAQQPAVPVITIEDDDDTEGVFMCPFIPSDYSLSVRLCLSVCLVVCLSVCLLSRTIHLLIFACTT